MRWSAYQHVPGQCGEILQADTKEGGLVSARHAHKDVIAILDAQHQNCFQLAVLHIQHMPCSVPERKLSKSLHTIRVYWITQMLE